MYLTGSIAGYGMVDIPNFMVHVVLTRRPRVLRTGFIMVALTQ